jgi:hypothetical protein
VVGLDNAEDVRHPAAQVLPKLAMKVAWPSSAECPTNPRLVGEGVVADIDHW